MTLKDIENIWVEDASLKYDSAMILFQNEKCMDSLFYLHLAIEKILKGLFVNQMQMEPPFMHNLLILANKITTLVLPDEIKQFLGEVNTFNINARYDDYSQNFKKICTKEYTMQYLEKGKEILEWLKSMLK